MTRFATSAYGTIKRQVNSAKDVVKSRLYISLSVFVLIVVLTSAAGYARYQHVQAELETQQDVRYRIQRGFNDWREDLSNRMTDLTKGVKGTAQGAGNIIGGAWDILTYVTKAVLDYIGNLHIMIPVTIIYFGVGFFGTLKMRAATLIGALIALLVSTSVGIVQGSVIGLLAIAGLLFWNKVDSRLLTAIQGLPIRLKAKLKQLRDRSDQCHCPESAPADEPADSPV